MVNDGIAAYCKPKAVALRLTRDEGRSLRSIRAMAQERDASSFG